MSKILNNKEALLAILDGKKIKSMENGAIYKYEDDQITFRSGNCWYMGDNFNNLDEFKLVEPERETITFYEHICDCGVIGFLTENKEYLSFNNKKSNLYETMHSDKCQKLYRNGVCQEVKVYANTLEYIEERE